jgi:hypothetical protein
MRDFFKDLVGAIKAELPNAVISWDISAWIGEQGMRTWWGYFKDLGLVDLVHTSGGQVFLNFVNKQEYTYIPNSNLKGQRQ